MKQYQVGDITISVQDSEIPNEDIYQISGNSFTQEEMEQNQASFAHMLAENVEDPERFVLHQEDSHVEIYTKQPDAAIQLAMYLNQKMGVRLREEEIEKVRNALIRKQ